MIRIISSFGSWRRQIQERRWLVTLRPAQWSLVNPSANYMLDKSRVKPQPGISSKALKFVPSEVITRHVLPFARRWVIQICSLVVKMPKFASGIRDRINAWQLSASTGRPSTRFVRVRMVNGLPLALQMVPSRSGIYALIVSYRASTFQIKESQPLNSIHSTSRWLMAQQIVLSNTGISRPSQTSTRPKLTVPLSHISSSASWMLSTASPSAKKIWKFGMSRLTSSLTALPSLPNLWLTSESPTRRNSSCFQLSRITS